MIYLKNKDINDVIGDLLIEDMERFVREVKHLCRLLEDNYGFNVTDVTTDGRYIIYHTDWFLSKDEFEDLKEDLRLMFVDLPISDVGLRQPVDCDEGFHLVLLMLFDDECVVGVE